ncbi:D-alanyl-D-alanine carboxypeptidase family protein [Sphingosinicellaceae bacterium]|nr:D-alanyl-D-alanine carboxypeptidase family protein [Sphingosinicellaceae bacterium]
MMLALGLALLTATNAPAACNFGPGQAAVANTASLRTLVWSPYGRVETGWEVYSPLIAHEVATTCGPATAGFAAALGRWQSAHKLVPTGTVDAQTFEALSRVWQGRRPYVVLRAKGTCPEPPATVVAARSAESYLGKTIRLRQGTLTAYRKLVAAAKHDVPALARDPRWLTIFSGFRDPASDATRCAREQNCNGIVRAKCSAHRSGLALDLYVGQAVGFGPDSSADANRRAMVKTAAYGWLLANAGRYGFVNYPFEPWHWEWTGEVP